MALDNVIGNIVGVQGREVGEASDYNSLTNKPKINGVTLSGDKSAAELGIGAGETWTVSLTSKTFTRGSVTKTLAQFRTYIGSMNSESRAAVSLAVSSDIYRYAGNTQNAGVENFIFALFSNYGVQTRVESVIVYSDAVELVNGVASSLTADTEKLKLVKAESAKAYVVQQRERLECVTTGPSGDYRILSKTRGMQVLFPELKALYSESTKNVTMEFLNTNYTLQENITDMMTFVSDRMPETESQYQRRWMITVRSDNSVTVDSQERSFASDVTAGGQIAPTSDAVKTFVGSSPIDCGTF